MQNFHKGRKSYGFAYECTPFMIGIPSSSNICDRQNSSEIIYHKNCSNTEKWSKIDIKTSVPVEKSRIISVIFEFLQKIKNLMTNNSL